jgi:hypothetical protein
MKENKFQSRVSDLMSSCGFYTLNVHGHMMQASGWPDLMGFHRRGALLAELKVGRSPLRASQKVVADNLEQRGWRTVVFRLVSEKIMECEGAKFHLESSPVQFLEWVTPFLNKTQKSIAP